MTSITKTRHGRYLPTSIQHHAPSVLPGTVLPPREVFEGHPEVQAAVDAQGNIHAAMRDHQRRAVEKRAAAQAAEAAHVAAVREATAAGEDATAITSEAPALLAQAAEHDTLAADAKRHALTHGKDVCAPAIAAVAPTLFASLEAEHDAAAAEVRALLEQVRTPLAAWTRAFAIRHYLSSVHYRGGILPTWDVFAVAPPEVSDALTALEEALDQLDALKRDEAALAAKRERDAAADEANRRALAGAIREG